MSLSFRSKLAAHAATLFAAAAEGLQEVQQKFPAESSLIPCQSPSLQQEPQKLLLQLLPHLLLQLLFFL